MTFSRCVRDGFTYRWYVGGVRCTRDFWEKMITERRLMGKSEHSLSSVVHKNRVVHSFCL